MNGQHQTNGQNKENRTTLRVSRLNSSSQKGIFTRRGIKLGTNKVCRAWKGVLLDLGIQNMESNHSIRSGLFQ